ncbi:MAG: nucleotidyltransferase domain-containing protein [Endomicrobium sp.]|jgi:type I restriction enzyme S subunit|nr:nucleotidyltransferase domain-containing protein [Endomicrobium sp.]
MTDIFIDNNSLKELRIIIKKLYPKSIVWAYGSRIGYNINNVHESSDLDLAVIDFGQDKHDISEFKTAFQESNIPFLIDILEFSTLPLSFQKEIKKKYFVIYDGQS